MIVTPYPSTRIGYHQGGDVEARRLAREVDGVTTATRSLPARYEQIFGLGDPIAPEQFEHFARVKLVLTTFGEVASNDLRVGVRSVDVDVVNVDGEPQPFPSGLLEQIRVRGLAVAAIQAWSNNDDDTPVTAKQARALLRPGSRTAESVEERWRRASRAYLVAKSNGSPTTEAVLKEFGYLPNQQEAARQMILRAARKGVLAEVAKEMDLSRFLTPRQLSYTAKEQS